MTDVQMLTAACGGVAAVTLLLGYWSLSLDCGGTVPAEARRAYGVLVVAIALIVGAAAWLTYPAPTPPPEPREPVTAEDVGRSTGKAARGYLRGVREGWREGKSAQEGK